MGHSSLLCIPLVLQTHDSMTFQQLLALHADRNYPEWVLAGVVAAAKRTAEGVHRHPDAGRGQRREHRHYGKDEREGPFASATTTSPREGAATAAAKKREATRGDGEPFSENNKNATFVSGRSPVRGTNGGAGNKDSPEFDIESGEGGKFQPASSSTDDYTVPSFCPREPFDRYVELYRNIVAGKAEQRYLVYRPYLICGLGNRLSGLQGVLALAVLTDRALLVDWWGGVSGGHQMTDKYEDNFLEPHGVPHNVIPSSIKDYANLPGTETWCQMSEAVRVEGECSPSRMTPDFLPEASWDDIYAANASVLVVQSHNANPFGYLSANTNPDVVKRLDKLDADFHAGTFRLCAMRFLYRPRPEFRRNYCNERSSVVEGKFPSVSLHIRTGDSKLYRPERMDSLPQDLENFMACGTGFDEGLAAIMANSSSDEVGDVDFANVDTVWLLGTDSDDVIDLLNQGNHTVDFGGKVAFIEGGDDHRAHSGSKGGSATNEGPLMDLAMLSESVLLVGSYHSSFTLHVAEIGGLPPAVRLTIWTPFSKIFGQRESVDMPPAVHFEDYRQGCRDFVVNPILRQEIMAAVHASREPFIDCSSASE